MLKVVALILERIKGLILYAPTSSSSSCNFVAVCLGNLYICDPSIMIKSLAIFFHNGLNIGMTSLKSGCAMTAPNIW